MANGRLSIRSSKIQIQLYSFITSPMCGVSLMLFIQPCTFSSYWLSLPFLPSSFHIFSELVYGAVNSSFNSSASFHTGSFYPLITANLAFPTLSLCLCCWSNQNQPFQSYHIRLYSHSPSLSLSVILSYPVFCSTAFVFLRRTLCFTFYPFQVIRSHFNGF